MKFFKKKNELGLGNNMETKPVITHDIDIFPNKKMEVQQEITEKMNSCG